MQRLQALIRSRVTANSRRQTIWDIVKIVGSLSLVFAPVAGLIVWFSHPVNGEHHAPEETVQSAQAAKSKEPTEVYLGEFSSVSGSAERAKTTPDSEGIRVVEFEVSGIMRGTKDEVIHFERRLAGYQNRIKAAMTEIARGATVGELNDAMTQSLRGKIRNKLNGLFRKPVFEEVVFGHFRMYEL
ncbi:hypothetical protein CA54_40100 [Symmachiella macrocystis]|uniref:Flagellar protein FliL n=1 Tax=Symmachiella macrocystis TaxID=2527985 RepID=A0A5C6B9L2_9PLAN|nr:hypothetical protein [Symmachiella macrocystis]TWU08773.1 hypothetical protein CA54_40100 [Symmachiella macrocystis]